MNQQNLPSIDQCPDLPHDSNLPAGFRSVPEGPAALVELDGVESVRAFAISFAWATADQRANARGWAMHAGTGYACAATMREFAGKLTQQQLASLNYSCNLANMYTSGAGGIYPQAYANVSPGRFTPVNSDDGLPAGTLPANFARGSGYSGQTTFEVTPAQSKQAAWNALMFDIEHGSYTYHGRAGIA